MRRFFFAAASLALLVLPAWGQAKPDFTGTWKLDPLRSRLDKVPHPKELVLAIAHKEPDLRVTVTRVTDDGESSETFDVPTDGTARQFTLAGHPSTVAAHWEPGRADHLVLETRSGANGELVTTRVMRLGDKGRMLSTVLTVRDAAGEKKAYEFFLKQ